jgi:hypothetical protein
MRVNSDIAVQKLTELEMDSPVREMVSRSWPIELTNMTRQ